jgi:glycosyltransferase involved in cell wall biosynthesis
MTVPTWLPPHPVLRTIWLTRPDLRALATTDPAIFEVWCMLQGVHEYQALAEIPYHIPQHYWHELALEADHSVQPMLTRVMRCLWFMRPDDLQKQFSLQERTSQQAFVWWYFLVAVTEYHLEEFVTPEQRQQVNQPITAQIGSSVLPITRLMYELWQLRTDIQHVFDIKTPAGATAFLAWYISHGFSELSLAHYLNSEQLRVLWQPHPLAPQIPCVLKLLHDADPTLQQQFVDPTAATFRQWASSELGQQRYPVLRRLMQWLQWPKSGVSHDQIASLMTTANTKMQRPRPEGINLIGYAKGVLGIGEDVRMAALALQAVGIPFIIYNINPGAEVCQQEMAMTEHLCDQLRYRLNLWCVTGIEMAHQVAVQGDHVLRNDDTIGYWPWELATWPTCWHHAYDLVDEVWASSRFTYEAYVASCPKPVRHMPMAVSVEATAGWTRRDFKLASDRFLFVFSFDRLSTFDRKNPYACIQAFCAAFPKGHEPVGLVIKAMRVLPDHPVWQAILDAAAHDPRIQIITETLSRGAILDLYRQCDCYVSLHRSEGFGRGLVEAMMLGKVVIATGYSGNLDFTLPGTAAVVDYRFCPVAPDAYPFADGLYWAEPDHDHAVWWMRQVVYDQPLRQQLATRGQTMACTTYHPYNVGRRYQQRLAYRHQKHA